MRYFFVCIYFFTFLCLVLPNIILQAAGGGGIFFVRYAVPGWVGGSPSILMNLTFLDQRKGPQALLELLGGKYVNKNSGNSIFKSSNNGNELSFNANLDLSKHSPSCAKRNTELKITIEELKNKNNFKSSVKFARKTKCYILHIIKISNKKVTNPISKKINSKLNSDNRFIIFGLIGLISINYFGDTSQNNFSTTIGLGFV